MERHNTDIFETSEENLKTKSEDEEKSLLCGYGSTHTGIISSWYDFAVLLVVFPVCHWGNSGHKGRWIGWGGVVMALGSLICALPHWLIAPYKSDDIDTINQTDFGQCIARQLESGTCHSLSSHPLGSYLNPYFLLFVLGQTLHGFGSTPLFSIGTTFLDENVSQKASPVYLGKCYTYLIRVNNSIHAVLTSFGPVIGVFVGGFLLNIYDDFDRINELVYFNFSFISLNFSLFIFFRIPLDRSDPRWIGAWWVGFLASSISALIIAFPILAFARELPEAKRHRAKDVNQVGSLLIVYLKKKRKHNF
uniref:MFS domain-containing protein n=1 Tax=Heterorhabditis bacteriophora TaxID=37862 RepID=A0A1I7WUU2_HETBA